MWDTVKWLLAAPFMLLADALLAVAHVLTLDDVERSGTEVEVKTIVR